MKPILIFDTTDKGNAFFQFDSSFIFQFTRKISSIEIDKRFAKWYGANQNVISDNEHVLIIITEGNYKRDDSNWISAIYNDEDLIINKKSHKEIIFYLQKNKVEIYNTDDIGSAYHFYLANENLNGHFHIDEKDKFHIIQIFAEYLINNYGEFDKLRQNARDNIKTSYSLGSVKYILSKVMLKENSKKIIEAYTYAEYVFIDKNKFENEITEAIKGIKLNKKNEDSIDTLEKEFINKHNNPASLQIKANEFLQNTIVDDKNVLTISLSTSQPDFSTYISDDAFSILLNDGKKKFRTLSKYNSLNKEELNEISNEVCSFIERKSNVYKRKAFLQIEKDFVNDYNTKINAFNKSTSKFVQSEIRNSSEILKYKTTCLENVIAELDFILHNRSEYAEKGQIANNSLSITKIIDDNFSTIETTADLKKNIYSIIKNIDDDYRSLRKKLKSKDHEIFEFSKKISNFESHLHNFKLKDVNEFSLIKLSWLPISNLTIFLSGLLFFLVFFLVFFSSLFLYWSIPLTFIAGAIVLYQAYTLKKLRKSFDNLLLQRESIISHIIDPINNKYQTIVNIIKNTYTSRLLSKYKEIIKKERYDVYQLRKYFIFQYYNSLYSINKNVKFNSNHIFNVISPEFVTKLVKKDYFAPLFKPEKLNEYLNEFKNFNRNKSVIEALHYKKSSLLDFNPEEVVPLTNEDQNSGNDYYYNSIPDAKLFTTNKNIKLIDIKDINQGMVGDCYFLAVLAGLAQTNPSILKNNIVFNSDEEKKYYSCRFYDNDKNELLISIDDKLYTKDGKSKTLYARWNPNSPKLWVALFEKAWAKINGGYENIIGSIGTKNRRSKDYGLALTGFYMKHRSINSFLNQEDFISFLDKIGYFNKSTIVTFGSLQNKTVETDDNLVTQHAYTLQAVNKTTKSFTLYNPHGDNHYVNINFNFLLNNFSSFYYFNIKESEAIRPSEELSIYRKIKYFDDEFEKLFNESDLYQEIENLNFYQLFWDNQINTENKEFNKIKEILNKTIPFIPKKIADTSERLYLVSISNDDQEIESRIKSILKTQIDSDLSFKNTKNELTIIRIESFS